MCSRSDDPTQHDAPAIDADTEHVCADGTVVADTAAPVASNEHGDAWCAKCGERLLLPDLAGGPTLEDKR